MKRIEMVGLARRTMVATIASATALMLMGAAAPPEQFKTQLRWTGTDLPRRPNMIGSIGEAQATFDGRKLEVSGSFTGMNSAATGANLYIGVASGARGPKFGALETTKTSAAAFKGSFTLNKAQAESLRAGKFYVQIDSANLPDGQLWGWLWPVGKTIRQLQPN